MTGHGLKQSALPEPPQTEKPPFPTGQVGGSRQQMPETMALHC